MHISGYISRTALSRKDHDRILIAINGRYISSPSVTAAVREGYGTLLPHGRYPVAFLSLAIDPRLVDINVHPTKKEVRLSKEREIVDAVRDAVRAALAHNNLIPEVTVPHPADHELAGGGIARNASSVSEPEVPYDAVTITPPVQAHTLSPFTEPTHAGTVSTDHRLRQTELASGVPPVTAVVPAMEVIGQVGGIYILAEAADGELIIIDQHAAHERIFYEQVSRSMAARHVQELLVPAIIHRPLKDAAILRNLIPALVQEGVVIEEFGSGSFLVRAVPALMGKVEGTEMIDDLVSDLIHKDPERPVTDGNGSPVSSRAGANQGRDRLHAGCQPGHQKAAEMISGDDHDKYIAHQSESHDRNGGRCESVRPVVRRTSDGNRNVATVWCSCCGSRTEFAFQGEAAWNDELNVGKSARHSSRRVTHWDCSRSLLVAVTAAIAQSYSSGGNKTKAVQFVFNACTLLNACRTRLPGLPQPDVWGPCGQRTQCLWCWPRPLISGEHGAGSEHHRSHRRWQSFCLVAQGFSVVVP